MNSKTARAEGSTRRLLSSGRVIRLRAILAYSLGPVLGLISGPILARSLGAEGRGQFAAIMQPISVAAAVASVGIPTAVAFFIAKSYDRRRTLYIGLVVCLPTALLTYLGMAWYATIVSQAQGISVSLLWALWTAIILSAFVQIIRAFWQGVGGWRRLDWERAVFAILRFGAVCVVAAAGIAVAGPYAVAALLAFVAAAAVLFIPRRELAISTDKTPHVRDIVKYSTSASLGTVAIVASSRLDQVALPSATSATELGFYAVAVTVAEVPMVFGVLAARNILQSVASGVGVKRSLIEVKSYLAVGIIGCVLAVGLSPMLIPLVFGSDFQDSVVSVQVLAISSIYSILTMSAISLLSGLGYPLVSSLVPLVSVIVTATLFISFWHSMTSLTAAKISLGSQVAAFLASLIACLYLKNRRR